MRLSVSVPVLTIACLCAASAAASPLELYGASARSSALAGSISASASATDALFHNPAALTRARSGVSMGLGVAFDQAGIQLKDRPEGYDINDLGAVTPTVPTELTLRPRSDHKSIGTITIL